SKNGIRERNVTGVQTCALPIFKRNSLSQRHRLASRRPFRRVKGESKGELHQGRCRFGHSAESKVKGHSVVLIGVTELEVDSGQEIGRASCRERETVWDEAGTE